eukprot:TRINITY_DN2073_c0_g1_i1.p1 TRINITY_DN2073_c0_g1~~TRINITY_DN2073_c0_g1_i1.p1  ORF type:complete len:811 (+),score=243.98 TRINITY_DN2073_c0_g1_i1:304-2433(+)
MKTREVGEGVSVFTVGFEGQFGSHYVTPRGLGVHLLGSLVQVEGIVTKCGQVRPKVARSVHYCEETKKFVTKSYRDATSMQGHPTGAIYPTKDDDGNPLISQFGMSTYVDTQNVTLQEMPERAPPGQLPRSMEVVLEGSLVDRVKPGDRIRVVAVYRALGGDAKGTVRGVFNTLLIANNVRHLGKEAATMKITEDDVKSIRKLSKSRQLFDILAESLSPAIYGHNNIKRALILQLLGGLEKNLETGTHLRGDINVLMVGDPGTAKSQLLRSVMRVAPLAIHTTGRGSSGVGLTAAVTNDPETKERRLEAGAMVLGDRGVVCIDEFDKMGDADRVAIHEVMEQQTVTIAKAGVHASLNARCAVLAAANPIESTYNRNKMPSENIALPDSLLSRFDCLFIVLDNKNAEDDRKVVAHIAKNHMYKGPEQAKGMQALSSIADWAASAIDDPSQDTDENMLNTDNLVWLQGEKSPVSNVPLLTQTFLKKYLQYAKRVKPALTDAAIDLISDTYASLREREGKKTLPITARTCETLIRLSTAFAKARLSTKVEKKDAEEASKVLKQALEADKTEESIERVTKRVRAEEEEEDEFAAPAAKAPRPRPKAASQQVKIEESDDEEEPASLNMPEENATMEEEDDEEIMEASPADVESVKACIHKMRKKLRSDVLPINKVLEALQMADSSMTTPRLEAAIAFLENENTIMYRAKEVHII